MIPVQEIDFYLSDKDKKTMIIQAEISLTDNKTFTAWHDSPLYLDKFPVVKTLMPLMEEYKTSEEAFSALVEKFSKLSQSKELEIIKVNNPNNCELISEKIQNKYLISKGLETEITVNDPPVHQSP